MNKAYVNYLLLLLGLPIRPRPYNLYLYLAMP